MGFRGRPRKAGPRIPCGQLRKPSKARTTDTACVYVMEARSGLLKVGSSWSPALRQENLQRDEKLELAIVWFGRTSDEDARMLERAVHRRLKNAQEHVKGEWYRANSDDVVAVIIKAAEEMGVTLETGEPVEGRGEKRHESWLRVPSERGVTKIWRF